MYQPPHFREDRLEVLQELVRAHPLGLLISAGPGGLMANPIPFVLDPGSPTLGPQRQLGLLRCHVAKANEQWRELEALDECLVVFQGPQAYVTPSWYATKRETGKVVPTWNYATVHAWGRPVVTHDPAWLRRQIDDLTDLREGRLPKPWAVSDAPDAFVASQMKGIVGIEIEVVRSEGKWKMSQNRNEADRQGVVEGLSAHGGQDADVGTLVQASGEDQRP